MPERTCVICRRVSAKSEMLRFVHASHGELTLDFEQRSVGRGAYCHLEEKCLRSQHTRSQGLIEALKYSLAKRAGRREKGKTSGVARLDPESGLRFLQSELQRIKAVAAKTVVSAQGSRVIAEIEAIISKNPEQINAPRGTQRIMPFSSVK